MLVFKFLDAQFAMKVLREKRLKISEFPDLNDPFELQGAIIGHPGFQEALIEHVRSMYGVMCFSRNWTNPMLWSHYADKHKGFCLGLELPASEVVYEPIYIDKPRPFTEDLERVIEGRDIHTFTKLFQEVLLLKYEGWSYEDETRVFASLEERDGKHAFKSFAPNELILREVTLGLRCETSIEDVRSAVTPYVEPPRIYRADLSPDRFEITRNEVDIPAR